MKRPFRRIDTRMPVWAKRGTDRLGVARAFAVPALLVVAALLRLSDIDWDSGHMFHPDERHILMVTEGLKLPFPIDVPALLTPESPLNPRSFAYGSFIFYSLRFVHWFVAAVADLTGLADAGGAFAPGTLTVRAVGRVLSALFDLGTVYVTFLLGRTLYGWRVGYLAAAFVAFATLHIQLSHFYASDTPMTFFVTLTLLMSARLVQTGSRRHTIAAVITAGLALTCKISAAPVLAAVAAGHGLRAILPDDSDTRLHGLARIRFDGRKLAPAVGVFAASLLVVVAVFFVIEPYALIDRRIFLANIAEQNAMVSGAADVPYTRQYADRLDYWYFIENLTLFGVGVPLGLAMAAGWLYVAYRAIREPRRPDLLLLAFVVPYFAITGSFHAKFIRYLLPITPVLSIFASIGLWQMYGWATRRAPVATVVEPDRARPESAAAYAEASSVGIAPSGQVVSVGGEAATGAAFESLAATIDDETRRWAELKGMSLFSVEEQPRTAPESDVTVVPVQVVEMVAPRTDFDEETLRFAQLKGIGLFDDLDIDETDVALAASSDAEPISERSVAMSASTTPAAPAIVEPRRIWTRERGIAAALIAFVTASAFLFALAYQGVYAGEHTAVAASRWIYANVPRGATLANEHWEEGFPVAVKAIEDPRRQIDLSQFGLRQVPLNLYEADDEQKLRHISSTLARADYILFFSNRLYGTIPRLPERYPMTTRYYQMLFGETLGFELAAAFTKYPSIAGISFADDTLSDPRLPTPKLLEAYRPSPFVLTLGRADEAYSVYDHPKVLIFRKVTPMTEGEYRAILAPALPTGPRAAATDGHVYRSILQTPEQAAIQQAGGTFADMFDRDGFANRFPLVVWVVMLIALTAVGAPLARVALPRLADGGLPLARALAVLAATWVAWMAVATTGIAAGRGTAYLGFAVAAALAATFARPAIAAIRNDFAQRKLAFIAGEAAFWVAFGYFTIVRAANPDLWHSAHGGEKPMDLAYLMATVKSASYPPYDPWFSGGILNYYYFGQMIVAEMIKLTGIVPTTAYNLAVPTLYALTVTGAFSVAYNLARRGGLVSERIAVGAGLVAATIATTFGNLGGAIQIGEGLMRLSGTAYDSLVPGLNYLFLVAVGLFNWLALGRKYEVPVDWYWPTTRVIPGTINEMPYFTFLYADLHAHMIALPFTLLAIAAATNAAFSIAPHVTLPLLASRRLGITIPLALSRGLALPTDWRSLVDVLGRAARGSAPIALAGLSIGALLPINSWDFPTYLGLVVVASFIPWFARSPRDMGALLGTIPRAVLIVALAYGLYLPFHRSFVSFYSSVRPTPDQSSPVHYLVIHGLFIFILTSYVIRDAAGELRATGLARSLASFARRWDRFPHWFVLRARLIQHDDGSVNAIAGVTAALIALIGAAAAFGYLLAGLLLALLAIVLWRLLSRPRPIESTFTLLLFATGLALSTAVEIVALDGDIGRMNTVFKFYLQIWIMWSIASAVALATMRDRVAASVRGGRGRAWGVVCAILIAASAIYPIVSTPGKMAERFDRTIPLTLDGTAYMESASYREDHPTTQRVTALKFSRDLRAIEWIWDNVKGSPVIAEGNAPLYRWGSRISIYTGLPTIIGWDWHQSQQRAGFRFMIEERLRDLRALFTDENVERTRALLAKYDVTYVYVGDMERAYYPERGLRKFDTMTGSDLDVVYDDDGVRIYRVRGKEA
ncbi:MAG: hypothetical protein EPO26_05765 [Chloroflexota bacterium]|nr:MAG: hypothetical protein EPO26_05765 [Chloroflexota bacterium]